MAVVRVPFDQIKQAIPVGTVSNAYTLAQHEHVAVECFAGMNEAGIDTDELRCELGLTALGEWMNLRVYFPERYSHVPKDKQRLDLRLEAFNSVDGSSRLRILLSWFRLVCSNGMVIRETKAELSDVHNLQMDLTKIRSKVVDGLLLVKKDLVRFRAWEDGAIDQQRFDPWINQVVTKKWNQKAACQVYHICRTGHDVELVRDFAKGLATEKPVRLLDRVPGSPKRAATMYHVSQALSWVATKRMNPDERVEWQSAIPGLIGDLATLPG